MKGARIIFAALLTASIASISFMGATLANFERAAQITHSNEIASGGKKNIDLYLKADSVWFLSPGAASGVDVYTVFLLKWRESDTSVFEWTKCPTTATTINVNSVDTNYYKFSFDTTKYDHLIDFTDFANFVPLNNLWLFRTNTVDSALAFCSSY